MIAPMKHHTYFQHVFKLFVDYSGMVRYWSPLSIDLFFFGLDYLLEFYNVNHLDHVLCFFGGDERRKVNYLEN